MINKRILEREQIRITLEEHKGFTSETIELYYKNKWIPIIASNPGYSALNYYINNDRHTKKLNFLKSTKKKIYYQIDDSDFFLKLDYCLEESNIIHIRYKLSNKKALEISKLLVNYSILLGDNPDFTWVPHLRPEEDHVMGDHIFRSPVIIYKKGQIAFVFIPDLKTLQFNRPFQSFIDFNLQSRGSNKFPQIFYGFGNYEPVKHVFFKHDSSKLWKIESKTDLTFRYYIIVFYNKSKLDILQFINDFFWKKYIRKNLYETLEPQVLPYKINVKEGFEAIFERHKYYGEFIINEKECGGIWQRSWAGSKKKPIEFIKPENLERYKKYNTAEAASQNSGLNKMINEMIYHPEKVKYFDNYSRRHAFTPRTAEIWNNAWFLNIRSAYAFKYFGDLWREHNLIEKSDRILNTLLNLPRIEGIFPSVIFPCAPNSSTISYINGVKAYLYSEDYNIVDACLTMYWALKIYQDFDKINEIIERSRELLELIINIQQSDGSIPVFINFKKNELIINEVLLNSASSGAMLMFLIEFYKINPEQNLISVAEKIANFLKKEIVPRDKWHDFEPFFSCTKLPLNFYDKYTNSHVMNTLCIYWCAESFKELYKITNNVEYLRDGEYILAVLSLFQQVWNMPYISYNTFGGFGVQNCDAELSDARQALFVRTYMEYYLLTGKEEYMERGIAALRASWALQLLKEYEEICAGNINGIETVHNVDKGAIYENYGHTGSDYRVHGQITFDWGVGTAATATAYTKNHFGDLYIDFRKSLVWGIDGILIKSFEFHKNMILIECEIIPNKEELLIKAREVPEELIEIILNGESIGIFEKINLEKGFTKIFDFKK
jgi:hypothetical protein